MCAVINRQEKPTMRNKEALHPVVSAVVIFVLLDEHPPAIRLL